MGEKGILVFLYEGFSVPTLTKSRHFSLSKVKGVRNILSNGVCKEPTKNKFNYVNERCYILLQTVDSYLALH